MPAGHCTCAIHECWHHRGIQPSHGVPRWAGQGCTTCVEVCMHPCRAVRAAEDLQGRRPGVVTMHVCSSLHTTHAWPTRHQALARVHPLPSWCPLLSPCCTGATWPTCRPDLSLSHCLAVCASSFSSSSLAAEVLPECLGNWHMHGRVCTGGAGPGVSVPAASHHLGQTARGGGKGSPIIRVLDQERVCLLLCITWCRELPHGSHLLLTHARTHACARAQTCMPPPRAASHPTPPRPTPQTQPPLPRVLPTCRYSSSIVMNFADGAIYKRSWSGTYSNVNTTRQACRKGQWPGRPRLHTPHLWLACCFGEQWQHGGAELAGYACKLRFHEACWLKRLRGAARPTRACTPSAALPRPPACSGFTSFKRVVAESKWVGAASMLPGLGCDSQQPAAHLSTLPPTLASN